MNWFRALMYSDYTCRKHDFLNFREKIHDFVIFD
jgi:hypothetical protein